MGVLSGIKGFFSGLTGSGGIVETAANTLKSYFPPDMSPEQLAEFELKMKELDTQMEQVVAKAENDAANLLNQRIAEYEGTASDLKAIPFFGPIMIFLRGLQRPVWGFATLYMDFLWFAEWATLTEKQESALMIINVLVLGFLFGERAIKNVMPLITKLFEAKKG
jgi:hypothetical protein